MRVRVIEKILLQNLAELFIEGNKRFYFSDFCEKKKPVHDVVNL